MSNAEVFASELGRVHRKWRARLDERFKETGLTQARWQALLTISRHKDVLTQRELAQLLGIEGPSLVRVLNWLEEKRLIPGLAADGDRRATAITPTEAARPLLAKISRIADELRAELLKGIPADELAVAQRVLKAIGDKLER